MYVPVHTYSVRQNERHSESLISVRQNAVAESASNKFLCICLLSLRVQREKAAPWHGFLS